jgi:DNA-binding transcriptional regulator PaaX
MAQADADAHIARALAAFQRKAPAAESENALLIAEAGHRRLENFLSDYSEEITAVSVAEAAALVNWFLNSIFYRRAVSTRPFLPAQLIPADDQVIASLTLMLQCALTDGER